jgi:hypothetical protein
MARHHGHRLSGTGNLAQSIGPDAFELFADKKNPAPFRARGWLLVAHPSYKLDQQHF